MHSGKKNRSLRFPFNNTFEVQINLLPVSQFPVSMATPFYTLTVEEPVWRVAFPEQSVTLKFKRGGVLEVSSGPERNWVKERRSSKLKTKVFA